jgi:hypothetical protein
VATHNTWSLVSGVQTLFAATDLQSLANNTSVLSTPAYDNSLAGKLDLLADFLLAIQYATGPPTAGTKVADLYLLPSADGTNFPSAGGSPSIPQKALFIGTFETRAPSTTVLEYLAVPGVPLPPLKLKVLLVNTSGVALHASASMFLKMQPYQEQSA